MAERIMHEFLRPCAVEISLFPRYLTLFLSHMRRIDYPEPLQRLVAQLKRLPGIGPRSAERIALWLVGGQARPDTGNRGREVAETILENAAKVRPCADCGFFTTEGNGCEICRDEVPG